MKKLYFSLLTCLIALPAAAEHITPQQALERLQQSGPRRVGALLRTDAPTCVAELPEIYVFNSRDGYMVLPADDIAMPMLAYGTGDYDPENRQLSYWLDVYAAEIRAARNAGTSDANSAPAMRQSRAAINPLIATRWGQDEPYNALCPELNGKRSVTGCVATAMAQVIRHHQWPAQARGSVKYAWQAGGNDTIRQDMSEYTFDYSLMTPTYGAESTEAQKNAVATLMVAAGKSVEMNYSPVESGASSDKIAGALLNNFDYDKGVWNAYRDYYPLSEWENIIYGELAQGRPVLYRGSGSGGGHAFVVDGYSNDGFFHLNWGWSGTSDGYFLLTALNPSALGTGGGAGGYNYAQSAVIGVQRPQESSAFVYQMLCTKGLTPVTAESTAGALVPIEEIELGQTFGIFGGFFNYSATTIAAGAQICFRFENTSDGSQINKTINIGELKPGYGYNRLNITPGADTPDGVYTITPLFRTATTDEWQLMRAPLNANQTLIATVANGKITFAEPAAASIEATEMKLTTPLYWDQEFELTFTAVNSTDREFIGRVIPVLCTTEGTIAAQAPAMPVTVSADSSQPLTYSGTLTAENAPETGNYNMVLIDENSGEAISQPLPVTLKILTETTTVDASDLKPSIAEITDKSAVGFTATVSCTAGYINGPLNVYIFPSTGGTSLKHFYSPKVTLEAGESTTINLTLDLSDFAAGQYFIGIFNNGKQLALSPAFTLPAESTSPGTGIDEVNADSGNAILYDLSGRRVTSPSRPGIYISNGRKILVR